MLQHVFLKGVYVLSQNNFKLSFSHMHNKHCPALLS